MDSDDESDTTTAATPAQQATTEPVPTHNNDEAAAKANTSPIQPSFTSIGSPEVPTHQELQRLKMPKGQAPPQLKSSPQGDAYPAVAKVEGVLDKSDGAL